MQRPWRNAACYLGPHGLLSLLSYRTQDHQPRDGTTHDALGLPHRLVNKKTLSRIAYSPVLLGHFQN